MPKLLTTRTAATATAAAAALTLALVATSQADGPRQATTTTLAEPVAAAPVAAAAAAPSVSGSPEGAFNRIADFYGAYIDAVYDHSDNGRLANQLRSFYLSKSLQRSLKTWEDHNHADGVLRAQNVPLKWKVTSDGNGMGKANATITLTWNRSGSSTSKVHVQADLRTKKIVAIKG
ncbi:hypothetical protein [Streptomyces sp. NRRL S-87]|uniref:hypothetical protein n=1 Tax=Streptomyces sp. NRRL S-87 TaxID=1463920 RepID=UPI0004C01081|nr:hypothetical protein [Streptomyces sp. NRRL S-87]